MNNKPWAYVTAAWSTDRSRAKRSAKRYCRKLYEAGYTPICPLLSLPEIINVSNADEFKDYIDMSEDMLRRSRILVVCGTAVDETVLTDIAIANRFHVASSTMRGVLTVDKSKKFEKLCGYAAFWLFFCASSDENALLASAFGEHRVRLKLVSVVGKEVIELIHEEIDKEISGKSVNIAVRMLKPELDQFIKGLNKAVQAPAKTAGKAVVNKIHPTSGRQSIKTLIKQGQGVSSIPLADEGLRDFQKIAKKYGVDFAVVRDREKSPPVYTVFFKAKDTDAVTRILQDYSAKQIKKPSVAKVSVLEKLKKFKEIVAAMPKKIVEKKKERSL